MHKNLILILMVWVLTYTQSTDAQDNTSISTSPDEVDQGDYRYRIKESRDDRRFRYPAMRPALNKNFSKKFTKIILKHGKYKNDPHEDYLFQIAQRKILIAELNQLSPLNAYERGMIGQYLVEEAISDTNYQRAYEISSALIAPSNSDLPTAFKGNIWYALYQLAYGMGKNETAITAFISARQHGQNVAPWDFAVMGELLIKKGKLQDGLKFIGHSFQILRKNRCQLPPNWQAVENLLLRDDRQEIIDVLSSSIDQYFFKSLPKRPAYPIDFINPRKADKYSKYSRGGNAYYHIIVDDKGNVACHATIWSYGFNNFSRKALEELVSWKYEPAINEDNEPVWSFTTTQEVQLRNR